MPMENLVNWWNTSSQMDRDYGKTAYHGYKFDIMKILPTRSMDVGCAVFALLSPNNDYNGNVDSMRKVVAAHRRGIPAREIEGLTCYRACAERAYRVLDCEPIDNVFGKNANKTYNFYRNILDPEDPRFVTIDGHMYNLWRGEITTLKEVAVHFKPKQYKVIADDFKAFARALDIPPSQLQATLWWIWKRVNRIRFDYQIDLPLELAEVV